MAIISALIKTIKFIHNHPLNKKSGGGLFRFFKWQLRSRLWPRKAVMLPFIEGTSMLVIPGMWGATGNYYCGLYEFEEMGFLLHLIRNEDLVVDVGANIGSYTILAAGVCGARVRAFEANPDTFKHLLDNIQLNKLADVVKAYKIALGAKPGTIKMTTGYDTINHVIIDESEKSGLSVPMNSLDIVLGDNIPCLIKIDVEGFETEVINGACKTLESKKCQALIIEAGGGARYGFDEKLLHANIEGLGFHLCSYNPLRRELLTTHKSNTANNIFVRDLKWARERISKAPVRTVNGVSF